jgi:hypothetical protein
MNVRGARCHVTATLAFETANGAGMDCLRQLEDLPREVEQRFVLPVLFLDRLPLLSRKRLTLRVGTVLTDQHECREEDRL